MFRFDITPLSLTRHTERRITYVITKYLYKYIDVPGLVNNSVQREFSSASKHTRGACAAWGFHTNSTNQSLFSSFQPETFITCFESSPDSVLSDSHNALQRCCPLRMPHAAWPAARNTPWERGPCRSRSARRASSCGTVRSSAPTVSLLCWEECGLDNKTFN